MAITIEIHDPELEALLQQRLKAGNFASVEAMLIETFKCAHSSGHPPEDARKRALAAAERLRELREGVTLGRPAGMTLREYAHIGHRY